MRGFVSDEPQSDGLNDASDRERGSVAGDHPQNRRRNRSKNQEIF